MQLRKRHKAIRGPQQPYHKSDKNRSCKQPGKVPPLSFYLTILDKINRTMDRTLRVYAATGHLFAEITIDYEHAQNVSARCTVYQPAEGPEDLKTVVPLIMFPLELPYREFASIEEMQAGDVQTVKEQLAAHMTDEPGNYTYAYDDQPVLVRYVAGDTGIVDIRFSFAGNTKHLKFISAINPRHDCELSSLSLETNISLISRIPVYDGEGGQKFDTSTLRRLSPMRG
jgi:hypothetical protein